MIRIMSIAIALIFMVAGKQALAQNGDIFDRLQKEPVSLFDSGIKRLRSRRHPIQRPSFVSSSIRKPGV